MKSLFYYHKTELKSLFYYHKTELKPLFDYHKTEFKSYNFVLINVQTETALSDIKKLATFKDTLSKQ